MKRLLVALAVLIFSSGTSMAATFVVDRSDDDPSASACTGAPNDCSFRGAVTAANSNGGTDTIDVSAADPVITGLRILVTDADTIIDGGNVATIDFTGQPDPGFPISSSGVEFLATADGGAFQNFVSVLLDDNTSDDRPTYAIELTGPTGVTIDNVTFNCSTEQGVTSVRDNGINSVFSDLTMTDCDLGLGGDGSTVTNLSYNETVAGAAEFGISGDNVTVTGGGGNVGPGIVGGPGMTGCLVDSWNGAGAFSVVESGSCTFISSTFDSIQIDGSADSATIGGCGPGEGNTLGSDPFGDGIGVAGQVTADILCNNIVEGGISILGFISGSGGPTVTIDGNTIVTSFGPAVFIRGSDSVSVTNNNVTSTASSAIMVEDWTNPILSSPTYSGLGDDYDSFNVTVTGNTLASGGGAADIAGLDATLTNASTASADNGGATVQIFWNALIRVIELETGNPIAGADIEIRDANGTVIGTDTSTAAGFSDGVLDPDDMSDNTWASVPQEVTGFPFTFPLEICASNGTTSQCVTGIFLDGTAAADPGLNQNFPFCVTVSGYCRAYIIEIPLSTNTPPTVDIQNEASPRPRIDQFEPFALETFIEDQEDTALSQLAVTIESDQEGVLFTGTADGSTARSLLGGDSGSNFLVSNTLTQSLAFSVLGPQVLTVTATDSSGASSSDTLLIQIIDPGNPGCSTSPVLTIESPETGSVFEVGDTITVSVNVDDPDLPADTLAVSLSSDIDGGLGAQGGLGAGTINFAVNLSDGLHALTATVSDSCPNVVDGSVFVTVVDPNADCDGDGTPDGEEPDSDGDGIPDDCDPCPQGDQDGDGICDSPTDPPCAPGQSEGCTDSCPSIRNTGQADQDGDGVGDACDNCPAVHNAGQADDDEDGIGNLCDDTVDPPAPPEGACEGESCTIADLVCLLQGTCDPAQSPIPFGPDPTEQCFQKWAGILTIEFTSSDPNALNTLLLILSEANRDENVLTEEDRDRLRLVIDDLMRQFWAQHRPLVGDLLALERDTGTRDLGAPAELGDPEGDGGCWEEYLGGCGSIGGRQVPAGVAPMMALALMRLLRRTRPSVLPERS